MSSIASTAGVPVLFLDTCILLDVMRAPLRPLELSGCVEAAQELLQLALLPPARCTMVVGVCSPRMAHSCRLRGRRHPCPSCPARWPCPRRRDRRQFIESGLDGPLPSRVRPDLLGPSPGRKANELRHEPPFAVGFSDPRGPACWGLDAGRSSRDDLGARAAGGDPRCRLGVLRATRGRDPAWGDNIHADYDGKDVEVMASVRSTTCIKNGWAGFAELVAEELEIACTGLGQTTWKRPQIARGPEADDCYCFAPDKLAMVDEAMAPCPECRRLSESRHGHRGRYLASKIDRPGIYAALGVAEVWRFDGDDSRVLFDRRCDDGTYQTAEVSGFLPVRPEEVRRWVLEEERRDGSQWARRLRDWVRAELAPRLAH